MEEIGDILDVVVRFVSTMGLLLGLTGVDALEDAQPPELGQLELQLLQSLVAGDILHRIARGALRRDMAKCMCEITEVSR